jgi:hypothetical protein
MIRKTVVFMLLFLTITFLTLAPSQGSGQVTYDCLETAGRIESISGRFEERLTPKTAPGKAFDARQAEFLINQVKWGMISVEAGASDTGMCWVGGYVYTEKPWDASWSDHKDLDGPTRNSAAIKFAATNMTVRGLHYFNVADAVRVNEAIDWAIEGNWGEYIRDDCVENDHLRSGRIYDCLFDGCYTGISTRPSDDDVVSSGAGELVELDHVLLRLQAMPYPYKWQTKKGIIDEEGEPYTGSGIPYGHGSFFKTTNVYRNSHFSIKNSVFLAEYLTEASKFDFPAESLIDACENNIVIWLGPGSFPGNIPTRKFPSCFTIVTGQKGRDLWQERVSDWHARHPDVGAQRKPKSQEIPNPPENVRILIQTNFTRNR